MSSGFIPNDPTLGLELLTFRDELGTGKLDKKGFPIRGRAGEQQAAAFWLEHRQGPKGRSLSDLEPRIGRSLSRIDVAGTVEAIERALDVVPASWRPCTVVAAGWALGVERLREAEPGDGGPPWLERSGLPTALPEGLSRYSLNIRIRAFREELIRRRLLIGAERERLEAEPTAAPPRGKPLVGWKAIADAIGVSEATARRYSATGLPVQQAVEGGAVWAFADELAAWHRTCRRVEGVSADERR